MILALASMAVLVFVGVLLRYLTSGTLVWADELSRYLMVWLAFLGIGPLLRVGGHVATDTLMADAAPSIQRVLRLVVVLVTFVSSVWLTLAGWDYVGRSWLQVTPVLGVPFAYVALAAPVSFTLTLWHLSMLAARFIAHGTFEERSDLSAQDTPTS
ncbi:hypothetical protein WN73_14710 [Bradyrhizobium sp. CCBAU 45394]|nr:hypothetical protein [Bradyrhizobium sp. CCBAU 45394]MDA9503913.1 hypothetical protein [Bradyrhizobium sp. CCBAU 11386]MDA9537351.1 hypothetical protein [Bradyrhizobium sp. CCBAU 21362]